MDDKSLKQRTLEIRCVILGKLIIYNIRGVA
jgi:hypothetical protein